MAEDWMDLRGEPLREYLRLVALKQEPLKKIEITEHQYIKVGDNIGVVVNQILSKLIFSEYRETLDKYGALRRIVKQKGLKRSGADPELVTQAQKNIEEAYRFIGPLMDLYDKHVQNHWI